MPHPNTQPLPDGSALRAKLAYSLALIVGTGVLLVSSAPLRASDGETRSEAHAAIRETVIRDTAKDATITARIRSSLLSHASTRDLATDVETTDGVVTVSGIVNTSTEKALVGALVIDTSGVIGVINNITVRSL